MPEMIWLPANAAPCKPKPNPQHGFAMRLIIISGLSGSGKSVALHTLEDAGYYCVDNLHPGLLAAFVTQLTGDSARVYDKAAVGIDARCGVEILDHFDATLKEIQALGVAVQIIFLHAETDILLRRFSETRRKHPLTRGGIPLVEAIELENRLLANIAVRADLRIDTTRLHLHQLSQLLRERLEHNDLDRLSLLFQSFGFKHGTPLDSDFVFDVRCLPNPYWEPQLRSLTGKDQAVMAYLQNHPLVDTLYHSLQHFLQTWLAHFEQDRRSYVTVSIGCTGGQHRSVYITERLSAHFHTLRGGNVCTRHRELS